MNINAFKNTEEISKYITKYIQKLISKSKGRISIALSGGNTPKVLFNYWAQHCLEKVDWNKVEFFWVDERCVPEQSEESNYGVANRLFLHKIPVEHQHIYCIDGENNPESEALFQSERLATCLTDVKGIPQFDLILLGMGNDGHTASIFPHQMELLQSKHFYDVGVHPQTGQKRITLTGNVLNNARNVLFMVSGEDKSVVLHNIIFQKDDYLKYPASHINPAGNLEWLVDSSCI